MMITPPAYPHCVYLMTKRDHVVIYVGVTSNLFARLGMHAGKSWWPEVALIQVESFASRHLANERETHLIRLISPFYNITGSDTGTARHLDEMRIATQAIRAGRTREMSASPTIAGLNIQMECQSTTGVSLAEAVHMLAGISPRPIGLHGLRTASQRAGFPPPIGRRGRGRTAVKLYDLDSLREWRRINS